MYIVKQYKNQKMKTLALTILMFLSTITIAQDYNLDIIRDSIKQHLVSENIPGMFVSIVKNKKSILEEGFGLADLSTNTKTDSKHLFRIGSITKIFTAMAILKLAEEGKFNLNESLKSLAPEIIFQNNYSPNFKVNIKDLLGHRAGFDDMHISAFTHERPSGMSAFDEVMAYDKSLKARWEPGLVHSYSNPGYSILGYLIEKYSGQNYQDYILEKIILPLGMKYTHFTSQTKEKFPNHKLAEGYDLKNDQIVNAKREALIGEAAGALLSNAEDMSKLVQYFLDESHRDSLNIISNSSLKSMEQFHGILDNTINLEDGYGLGLYTSQLGEKNYQFWGHNGGINGFLSYFYYSKELDLGIAMSANLPAGSRQLIESIIDQLTKHIDKNKTKLEDGDLNSFKNYEGCYQVVSTRNELFRIFMHLFATTNLTIEGDSLYMKNFLNQAHGYSLKKNASFQRAGKSYSTLHLTEFQGNQVLFYEGDYLQKTNSLKFWCMRIPIGLSFLTAILCLLNLIIRLIAKIFKKGNWKSIKDLVIYSLPVVCFGLTCMLFLGNSGLEDLDKLGKFSITSFLIFILSVGILIFAILSCIHFYKNKGSHMASKIFFGTSCFSSMFLALYCLKLGWIGMATWIY